MPDDLDARLVVPPPEHAYSKESGNAAEQAARAMLESRGTTPCLYRNTLVFLARILGIRAIRSSDVEASLDADWHTMVTLEIGPHPGLSDTQKKVIALDYGTRGGKTTITVRRALLYYTLKRLGLDADTAARKPADQQIVLLSQ